MRKHTFKWSPARIIAGAFGSISFIGSILLYLPWAHMPGQEYNICRCLVYCGQRFMCDRLIYCRYSNGFQPFWAGDLGDADTGRGAWRFYHGSRRTAYAWTESRDTAKKSDS